MKSIATAAVTASLASGGGVGLAGADPLSALRHGARPKGMSVESALILASVGQGDQLRQDAARLGCLVDDDRKLFLAPVHADMGNGLKATIVGPLKDQLEALQAEWDKEIKKKKHATPEKQAAAVAAFVDVSVPNLSSIVILVELDGKRMLLTGDARGDLIIAGLQAAKLLDGGKLHVDVLKVPHHGSDRDLAVSFFQQITADHYVISANGKYGNPDQDTLEMIATARGKDEFVLHLTNHDGEGSLHARLDKFLADAQKAGAKFRIAYLGEPGPIRIELGAPLGF